MKEDTAGNNVPMVARRLRGGRHSSMEAGHHHNNMERQGRTTIIKGDMGIMIITEAMEDMDNNKIIMDNTTTPVTDEDLHRSKIPMGQDLGEVEDQRQTAVEGL